jgi:hypothetical protein
MAVHQHEVAENVNGKQPNDQYRLSEVIHGGAVGRRVAPAAPPVNNFAAAQNAARDFGWPRFSSVLSLNGFPAPAGQVC